MKIAEYESKIAEIKTIRCFCGFLATQNGNFIRWEPYRANKDIIAVLRVCVVQLFTLYWVMIGIVIFVVLIIAAVKIAKWATKDIAGFESDKKDFNPNNVYHDNYTQGRK